jgi:hypothetical protein
LKDFGPTVVCPSLVHDPTQERARPVGAAKELAENHLHNGIGSMDDLEQQKEQRDCSNEKTKCNVVVGS